jgi:hypothetical protein
MERKDSVPAVSQPVEQAVSAATTAGWVKRTLQFDDFVLLGYGDEFGAELDAKLGLGGLDGVWRRWHAMGRTVGSGLARKRWSVSRMRREDLPTPASPTDITSLADRRVAVALGTPHR